MFPDITRRLHRSLSSYLKTGTIQRLIDAQVFNSNAAIRQPELPVYRLLWPKGQVLDHFVIRQLPGQVTTKMLYRRDTGAIW